MRKRKGEGEREEGWGIVFAAGKWKFLALKRRCGTGLFELGFILAFELFLVAARATVEWPI